MSNHAEDEFLKASEVAALLRVKPNTVMGLCRSGDLQAFRVGKSWRIRRSAVDEYLQANSNAQASA